MARSKLKIRKIMVSLSEAQDNALREMMKEDLIDDTSGYFVAMLSDKYTARQLEKNKRGAGRPPAEKEPDLYAFTGDPEEMVCIPQWDGTGRCDAFIPREAWYNYHAIHGIIPRPEGPMTEMEYIAKKHNLKATLNK